MEIPKKQVDICFSPALYPYYATDDSIVVVIDVLRATSVMCIAFEYGVDKILPLASEEETLSYRNKGYLVAGERDGVGLENFDFGNSPFSYMTPEIKGKKIAITTTNGTLAIDVARNAYKVAVGSFLNYDAIVNWIIAQERNVLLLCAGWRQKFNFEDAIFAGAIAERLIKTGQYETSSDSVFVGMQLYSSAKKDMFSFLRKSSHRIRLKKLNLKKEIKFCFTFDQTYIVPVLEGNHLVNGGKYKSPKSKKAIEKPLKMTNSIA